MKLILRIIEYVIFHLFWVSHVIYNGILSIITRSDDIKEENRITTSDDENYKRHFIHLYTTSGSNGRPVCYMDVYEIFSSTDEKKLRYAASRGIPNKTYMKYHQNKLGSKDNSQEWLEYSTLTL